MIILNVIAVSAAWLIAVSYLVGKHTTCDQVMKNVNDSRSIVIKRQYKRSYYSHQCSSVNNITYTSVYRLAFYDETPTTRYHDNQHV